MAHRLNLLLLLFICLKLFSKNYKWTQNTLNYKYSFNRNSHECEKNNDSKQVNKEKKCKSV